MFVDTLGPDTVTNTFVNNTFTSAYTKTSARLDLPGKARTTQQCAPLYAITQLCARVCARRTSRACGLQMWLA